MQTEGPSLPRELVDGLADRYVIQRELGAGGMATVYLAHDVRHDRDVAIKVLHPELGAAIGGDRFLAEIKTTAKLQHPHILPLLDSGQVGALLYYVMPFVAGETLRSRMEREGQLPIDDVIRIAREVADALGAAHAIGIIHRDVKPENILLQGGHALVADFGIALAVQHAGAARMTQTGLSLGTPQYMSPEQAMGEKLVDHRTDIYALGAVTYEMLVGDPPFTGSSVQAIIAKAMSERPTPPSTVRDTVPPALEGAVLRALAKLPADRFSSAQQFADALTTTSTSQSSAHSTRATSRENSRVLRAWQAVAAIALIAAGTLYIRRPADEGHLLLQRNLTFLRNVVDVAISPDGLWIAYLQDDCALEQQPRCTYTLSVREVDGAQAIRIARWASIAQDIHWTGDGQSLVFRGAEQGGMERVYITGRLGGNMRQLPLSPTAMTIMPDGRTLVAATGPSAQQRLERWDLTTLTLGDSAALPPFVSVGSLAASPRDGTLAAYASVGSTRSVVALFAPDARILDTMSVPSRDVVRWDPAGKSLLIFDDGEAGGIGDDLMRIEVRKSRFDHGVLPAVVLGQVESSGQGTFDVAPTGRVAIVSSGSANEPMIASLASGDRQWHPLPNGARNVYGRARFTPDGRALIAGASDHLAENLYIVPLDTARPRGLTAYRGWAATGGRWAQDAEYSPDGKRILFTRGNGRGADLAFMDSAGGRERLIAPAILSAVAQWLDDDHVVVFRHGAFVTLDTVGRASDSLAVPDSLPMAAMRMRHEERTMYFSSGSSLFAADLRARTIRRIASFISRLTVTGWLPDGTLLVSNGQRGRDGSIFRVDQKGELTPFMSLPHGCIHASVDSRGSQLSCLRVVPEGDVVLAAFISSTSIANSRSR